MKLFRKIAVLILILLVVIQFVQPNKNVSEGLGEADISRVYNMPSELHETLKAKCYDCHSNNTRYPWYFNVQPVGWWLAAHVHEGKEHLNFSAFGNYDAKRTKDKLEDISEVTEEGTMPLKPYVMLHPEAGLTAAEKKSILDWIATVEKNN